MQAASAKALAAFSRLSWWPLGAVVAGVMLARWTWILLAPASVAVAPAPQEIMPDLAGRVFGVAAQSAPAAAALPDVRLLGVFSGAQGFAILELADKTQRGVALGEEVAPGVKLILVARDHVLLSNGAIQQRVELVNERVLPGGVRYDSGLAQAASSSLPAGGGRKVEHVVQEWNAAQQRMQQERGRRLPEVDPVPADTGKQP